LKKAKPVKNSSGQWNFDIDLREKQTFFAVAEKNGVSPTWALRSLIRAYILAGHRASSFHLDGQQCPVSAMLEAQSKAVTALALEQVRQAKLDFPARNQT
jgi:hypothetical protein